MEGDIRPLLVINMVLFGTIALTGVVYLFTDHPVWLGAMFGLGVVGLFFQFHILRKETKMIRTVIQQTYGKPIRDMNLIKAATPSGKYVVNFVEQDSNNCLLLLLWSHTGECRSYFQVKDGLMDESSVIPELGESVLVKYDIDGGHARILFLKTERYVIPDMEIAKKGDYTGLEDVPAKNVAAISQ